jgi:hypothetical protein
MKKIDVTQAVSILANAGVITGIVFLVIEISQTNDQLASQARNTIFELRAGLERDVINNVGNIADVLVKSRRGEALTDVEQSRLLGRRYQMLQTFQYMVQEDPAGARLQARYMAAIFQADPRMLDIYNDEAVADGYDPLFVEFMEENVVPLLVR